MTVVYSENAPSHAAIKHWAECHRERRSLEDKPAQSTCPSKAVCKENCCAVENMVLQNSRVNVQLIANTLGISRGSIKTILREHMMTKVCAR